MRWVGSKRSTGGELRVIAVTTSLPIRRRTLTRAEQRMWFLEQLAPQRPSANLCNGFVIEGQLDVEQLRQATAQVIDRHDALRSCFVSDAQQNAVCQTLASVPFAIEFESLTGQTREQKELA